VPCYRGFASAGWCGDNDEFVLQNCHVQRKGKDVIVEKAILASSTDFMQAHSCLFYGNVVELIHIHGHYQCPVCKTNALPCCDGDNCETNLTLLRTSSRQALEKLVAFENIKPPHKGALEGL
jgi:hypothetical protein